LANAPEPRFLIEIRAFVHDAEETTIAKRIVGNATVCHGLDAWIFFNTASISDGDIGTARLDNVINPVPSSAVALFIKPAIKSPVHR
jgi:hypothetical protein